MLGEICLKLTVSWHKHKQESTWYTSEQLDLIIITKYALNMQLLCSSNSRINVNHYDKYVGIREYPKMSGQYSYGEREIKIKKNI